MERRVECNESKINVWELYNAQIKEQVVGIRDMLETLEFMSVH